MTTQLASARPEIAANPATGGANVQSNRERLDCFPDDEYLLDLVDEVAQFDAVELADRSDYLHALLGHCRDRLGPADPFGDAIFGRETPVVVLLRALARVTGLGSAVWLPETPQGH